MYVETHSELAMTRKQQIQMLVADLFRNRGAAAGPVPPICQREAITIRRTATVLRIKADALAVADAYMKRQALFNWLFQQL